MLGIKHLPTEPPMTISMVAQFLKIIFSIGHIQATVNMWKSEHALLESVLSFYCVGSGDRAQVIKTWLQVTSSAASSH